MIRQSVASSNIHTDCKPEWNETEQDRLLSPSKNTQFPLGKALTGNVHPQVLILLHITVWCSMHSMLYFLRKLCHLLFLLCAFSLNLVHFYFSKQFPTLPRMTWKSPESRQLWVMHVGSESKTDSNSIKKAREHELLHSSESCCSTQNITCLVAALPSGRGSCQGRNVYLL